MLRIRQEQLQAIQLESDYDFVRQAVTTTPISTLCSTLSTESTENVIKRHIAKAHEYGIADRALIIKFVALALCSDPTFYDLGAIDGFLRLGTETVSDRFKMLLDVATHLARQTQVPENP